MLTFELNKESDVLTIHGDKDGLENLINYIEKVIRSKSHDHLMTPSWAGSELTEQKQSDNSVLINNLSSANF